MPFLVCARCPQRLTGDIELTSASARDMPGQPSIQAGAYMLGKNGVLVLNHDDVTGVVRHPDPARSGGCCGQDGDTGPNLVCRGCGKEVATEESDCWKPHRVTIVPNAAKLITRLT